jgi:hypothetical protein
MQETIHLLTGYEGNNIFIVPKVPTIFRGNVKENSWYRGDNTSVITRISSLWCVLLYWTTVQFKILNCRPFADGFLVYFTSVLLKLIHYLKKKLIKTKTKTTTTFFIYFVLFCMDIDICPLLEGDMLIPFYTSFNLNQWNEWFRKVKEYHRWNYHRGE